MVVKLRTLLAHAVLMALISIQLGAQPNPVIVPEEDAQTPEMLQVVWETEPGIEYEALSSPDLATWTTVPGFPVVAEGISQSVVVAAAAFPIFYRVDQIAEEPPSLEGFALILAGDFIMGSPLSEPGRYSDEVQHAVTLTRSFYLQTTEVTWTQWNAVREWALPRGFDLPVGRNGSMTSTEEAGGTHPVTEVSWYEVVKWLNAKSEQEGLEPCYRVEGVVFRSGKDNPTCDFTASGYRLPTEAEWEYACRAGTTTAFYNGPITNKDYSPVDPSLDLIGWYGGNTYFDSKNATLPVGGKQPNAWGLYDMSGNVYEWCWDGYWEYSADPVTDPTGKYLGNRVRRGGEYRLEAWRCRSAARASFSPSVGAFYIGFRTARTQVP